jgi:hypothetical protein
MFDLSLVKLDFLVIELLLETQCSTIIQHDYR